MLQAVATRPTDAALPGCVLITTDAVGGVWRYSVELSRGLAARGCQVTLAAMGPTPSASQLAEVDEVAGVELVNTGLPLDWLAERPAELNHAARALTKLAASVDVVLLHAPALMGTCPWPVPVAAMAHSCVGTWWDAVRGGRVAPDYDWRARATSDGLRRADAIAVPSHAFAEALHRVHGVGGLTVVYNGRDPVHLPGVPRSRAVLTAGRLWDDAKNARMLDAVAARLSAPLRAAGPTEGPGGARVALQHTSLLGKLSDRAMGEALARASVFASAALYEPFGLAVLEAAQAGLALVLSDIPTFRELWDGAAVFVPPSDVDAWVAALEQMLAAPAAWANRARLRAARYGAAAMVDATAALLSRVIRDRLRRGVGAGSMRIVYFTHSLRSCWNHGNAHFLRGVLRALKAAGHDVLALEPAASWSRSNLVADAGAAALEGWRAHYPGLDSVLLEANGAAEQWVEGADAVLVHEWTDPSLVAQLGRLRAAGAPWLLLFHDTHHRAVSDPAAMQAFDLSRYDAVLAFGEALAAVYRRWGWGSRVFVWHEAADTALFHPPTTPRAAPGRRVDRQLGRRRTHGRAGALPARPAAPRRREADHPRRPLPARRPGHGSTLRCRLSRLAPQPRRARRVCPSRADCARAPPLLRHRTPWHPHYPGV